MFKEMRRKDREIGREEIEEILVKGEYGFLSTISGNGYPYVVPISFVYYNNSIYFHCATDGHKLENIKNNNKVSFSVAVDTEVLPRKFTTKYQSIIAFGTAREIEGDLKEEALFELIKKYSQQFLTEGKKYLDNAKDKTRVMKIEIEHITGKSNG